MTTLTANRTSHTTLGPATEATEVYLQLILNKALNDHFSEQELVTLSQYMYPHQFAKGDYLWKEGDRGNAVALIVEGQVEVLKNSEFPDKRVVVGIYNSGAIVGELEILDGHPRSVSAKAREDVDVLFLSRDGLEQLTRSHPPLGVKIMRGMYFSVARRLRKSYDRLASIF